MDVDFPARLKTALTGSSTTPFVFVGNFDVERRWGRGENGLPTLPVGESTTATDRLDELALLLAGADDHVVVKAPPDPDYLAYLDRLGLALPRVLAVEHDRRERTVTEDAIDSTEISHALAEVAARGGHLHPHGVSDAEERFAVRTGLRLAGAPASVCKAVNSKVYSRRVAETLGLRRPPGRACASLDELADAIDWARGRIRAGRRVVVKDAFGVSGRGLVVVDDERRLDRLRRMVDAGARRAGDDRVALVVEEWVRKRTDLNYHFTVGVDGAVRFDFVKEAVTDNGVHTAHRMPAHLGEDRLDELETTAEALGKRLAADGYVGVVGVDAMVDPRGRLYPMIEINARNNMSTYQARLHERFLGSGEAAMARQYPIELSRPLSFGALRDALGDLLLARETGVGLLPNGLATVNAAATDGSTRPFDGRLYGFLVARDERRLADMDRGVTARLNTLAR